MIIETQIKKNYISVFPEGRLDLNNSQVIEKELMKIIDAERKHLIVNMKNVEYLHSSGIRLLISLRNRLLEYGKYIVICQINDTVLKIIEFVDLQGIIEIFNSEEEAIDHVASL